MAYNHGHGHNREWDRGKEWQQGPGQGYNDWNGGGNYDWHGHGGNNDWHGGGGRRERDWEDEYAGEGKRRKFNDGVRLLYFRMYLMNDFTVTFVGIRERTGRRMGRTR